MTWNPTENNVFAIFLLGQCLLAAPWVQLFVSAGNG